MIMKGTPVLKFSTSSWGVALWSKMKLIMWQFKRRKHLSKNQSKIRVDDRFKNGRNRRTPNSWHWKWKMINDFVLDFYFILDPNNFGTSISIYCLVNMLSTRILVEFSNFFFCIVISSIDQHKLHLRSQWHGMWHGMSSSKKYRLGVPLCYVKIDLDKKTV